MRRCNRCLAGCQGGDDPIPGAPWRKAECHLCFNCVANVPPRDWNSVHGPASDAVRGPNLERRKLLAGVGAGLAIVPVLRATPGWRWNTTPG